MSCQWFCRKAQASGRPTSLLATVPKTLKASCFLMPLSELKAISRYLEETRGRWDSVFSFHWPDQVLHERNKVAATKIALCVVNRLLLIFRNKSKICKKSLRRVVSYIAFECCGGLSENGIMCFWYASRPRYKVLEEDDPYFFLFHWSFINSEATSPSSPLVCSDYVTGRNTSRMGTCLTHLERIQVCLVQPMADKSRFFSEPTLAARYCSQAKFHSFSSPAAMAWQYTVDLRFGEIMLQGSTNIDIRLYIKFIRQRDHGNF